MKQKIVLIVICGIGIVSTLTLLIWSLCDISNVMKGIEHIKNLPEVWGSNPDLSYNYSLLREFSIKAILAFVSFIGFLLMEINVFKPFLEKQKSSEL